MSDEAVKQVRELLVLGKDEEGRTTREGGQQPIVRGAWYWVEVEDKGKTERRLGCVTDIGSNYAEVTFPLRDHRNYAESWSARIHFDKWDSETMPEPNAQHYITQKIEYYRRKTMHLLEEVKDVTARLAINAMPEAESEAGAIVVSAGAQPVEDYKAALVRAKDETLPELFKKIEMSNAWAAGWMKAELLPMRAQVKQLQPQIKRVEARIFNVELYAGLIEKVVQVRDGAPAPPDTPVHLMQRRAYMDEECLVDYQTGGMEFKDIGAFDRWMATPAHCDRLLPHPRCVLAMQVRRHLKARSDVDAWIKFELDKADKLTFLYMRNGDQLYRLATGIQFDEQLFPDLEHTQFDGAIYAEIWGDKNVQEVISEARLQGLVEDDERDRREHAAAVRAWKQKVAELRAAGQTENLPSKPWRSGIDSDPRKKYTEVTPASVHYDDVMQFIAARVEAHNRLVLVLQGLFDRSPVFHPHPPVKLWEAGGFLQAVSLVYDDSRALVSGPPPDFEAYRARLNATIAVGSITLGQERCWTAAEARKENERQRRDWRISRRSEYEHFRPYGNPGPGAFARVTQIRGGRAKYEWKRERQSSAVPRSRWAPEPDPWIDVSFWAPFAELLHVDAYRPGDFRQFFADPRTRADYLQWAPLLLEAEEYHAGHRRVGEPD